MNILGSALIAIYIEIIVFETVDNGPNRQRNEWRKSYIKIILY